MENDGMRGDGQVDVAYIALNFQVGPPAYQFKGNIPVTLK